MVITFKDFSGGLNTESTRTELTDGEYGALKNLLVSPLGNRAILRPGQHVILPSGLSTNEPLGFISATISGVPYLVYASTTGQVIARNENTATETIILPGGGATTTKYEFARYTAFGVDKVFWCNGVGSLMEWQGGGFFSANNVGILAPGSGITVGSPDYSPGAGGLIVGKSYAWYFTNGTPDGYESNPSPITPYFTAPVAGRTPGDTYGMPLSGISTAFDSRVDRRYIYRVGDNLTTPTRVGAILNNTGTTFIDTVSDLDAGTITLSLNHTIPPGAIEHLVVNKSRLILSKQSTILVSSLARPEYFPVDYTDPLIDGFQFGIDNDPKNPVTALGTIGSATLICRLSDIYLLQGQAADQMTFNRIANVGCVATRSLAMCSDLAVWLGGDPMIWALGAGAPVPLGQKIERTLKSIPAAWLPNACAAYTDNRYIICIPGPGSTDIPYVFCFDFRTDTWTDLSDRMMAATQLSADQGFGTAGELLLATAASYVRPDTNTAYSGIVSAFSRTDTIDAQIDIQSRIVSPFGEDYRARINSVRVRGKLTPSPGQQVILTLTATTTTTNERQYILSPGAQDSSILLERNVDAILQGRDLSWRITGTARVFELEQVALTVTKTGQVIV